MNNLPNELVREIVMMSRPTYPYIHQLKFAVKNFEYRESRPKHEWYYHFIEYHDGEGPYDHYPWGHCQWSDTESDRDSDGDSDGDSDSDIEIPDF